MIAPFTSLHGATAIGARARSGRHATVIDTRVGDEATVLHSYVKEAEIGDRVSASGRSPICAPAPSCARARRRARSSRSRTPRSAPGTKVPHLSYIGDADIGEGTNLGASTITANYDGYRKHRTTIGSRVKTSVDTTLIAPVTVGDDAYTAAGSVISKDVPPGALGVARARQQNIEGYAERRKQREAPSAEEPRQE